MNINLLFKRVISGFLVMIMVAYVGVFQVNAAEYAYSFGTEYKDNVDTSRRAEYAAMYFKVCGYKSYYKTEPYESYMKGNNPNGVRRVCSEVVSHNGHANYHCVAYRWAGSTSPMYKTGIYYGNDYTLSDTKYVGVTDSKSDFSNTKFVEYIGCKTGSGSTNLVTRTRDEGAECVLGKQDSVQTGSQTLWTNRFNYKLSLGDSVNNAVNYANGFTYNDSRVKKNLIKGNGNLKIKKSKSSRALDIRKDISENFSEESLATYERHAKEFDERKTVEISKIAQRSLTGDIKTDTTNQLASTIKGFDSNNYKQVVSEGAYEGDYIIDYLELVNGCETESGYSVIVENNTIKAIYDNTIPISAKLKSDLTLKPVMTKDMIEKAYTEATLKYANDKEYEVTCQSGKLVYDLKEGHTVYRVRTEYYLSNETFFVDIYDYVI